MNRNSLLLCSEQYLLLDIFDIWNSAVIERSTLFPLNILGIWHVVISWNLLISESRILQSDVLDPKK